MKYRATRGDKVNCPDIGGSIPWVACTACHEFSGFIFDKKDRREVVCNYEPRPDLEPQRIKTYHI